MPTLAVPLRVLRTRLVAALVAARPIGRPLVLREIRLVAGGARRALRTTLAMAAARMRLAAARAAVLRPASRILVRLVLTRLAAFGPRRV